MSAVRAACFTFAALLVTSPALAAGLTPAEREVARTLATRGFELFQSKDYPHAIESFEQAESRIHAPPHLLYIARSQSRLGKLLAAKATYERILAEKLPDGSPLPFRDAQASAKSELAEVDVLIPSIELTLSGPSAAGASVSLDDHPFPASALGQSYPADPGLHTFVVTPVGGAPIERTFAVKADGATEHVNIAMDDTPSRSVAPIIVSFTLGGLALGVGGATLGLYLTRTPPSAGLRIASIASFAAGGVGVGAGIVLLAIRPSKAARTKPQAKAGPQITATIGPGSIGLAGSF